MDLFAWREESVGCCAIMAMACTYGSSVQVSLVESVVGSLLNFLVTELLNGSTELESNSALGAVQGHAHLLELKLKDSAAVTSFDISQDGTMIAVADLFELRLFRVVEGSQVSPFFLAGCRVSC